MRPFHAVVGLVAVGVGLAGWVTIGQAQPRPSRPVKAEVPSPRPKPVDDPFTEQAPIIRTGKADAEVTHNTAAESHGTSMHLTGDDVILGSSILVDGPLDCDCRSGLEDARQRVADGGEPVEAVVIDA